MKDIYFDKNYGKLYEKCEKGEAINFELKSNNGLIINQFIKREIPIKINNQSYYDIITPYGYGGPYIVESNNKEELIKDYEKAFSEYCKNNNIVAEFIRFHPLFNNAKDFNTIYDISMNRYTLGTNLKDFEDPIKSEFSKSCRQNIRKKIESGISYKITLKPTDLTEFKKVYYSTMDRNEASDYYYFDDEYFEKMKKYYHDNLILVEAIYNDKTIAAGLYYLCNKIIHIHLSGTLKEYLNMSPAYILRYAITIWGKENGYELIHHGGGRSSSEEDNLYKFKKQFAKNTKFEFYIGKKVWNKAIYNKLCQSQNIDQSIEFFPAYRKEL